MPPPPILDPAAIDCSRVLYSHEQIYEILPQRYEFAQLDGVTLIDAVQNVCVGFRDVREDEWWCRGHIPGRPVFPGVLMVECAAQLAAFVQHFVLPMEGNFMGFGGIDDAKFRGSVIPPARIILIGKMVEARPRRFICDIQAYTAGNMVFEGRITGMPLKL